MKADYQFSKFLLNCFCKGGGGVRNFALFFCLFGFFFCVYFCVSVLFDFLCSFYLNPDIFIGFFSDNLC